MGDGHSIVSKVVFKVFTTKGASAMSKRLSPLRAIRKHCLWCANGSFEVVRECNADGLCPLHPLRMGRAVKGISPLKTIRAKCLECVESPKEVRECTGQILTGDFCPLHEYRFGRSNRPLSKDEKDQRIQAKNARREGER